MRSQGDAMPRSGGPMGGFQALMCVAMLAIGGCGGDPSVGLDTSADGFLDGRWLTDDGPGTDGDSTQHDDASVDTRVPDARVPDARVPDGEPIECPVGYAGPTCSACADHYIEWVAGSGICEPMVPSPHPAAPTDPNLRIGALFMTGGSPEHHFWRDLVRPSDLVYADGVPPGYPTFPQRKPLIGYYNEGDPDVTDWQIRFALEHGISYFVYTWYRRGDSGWTDPRSIATKHEAAIVEGLFRAKYRDRFSFAILFTNTCGTQWPAWVCPSLSLDKDNRDKAVALDQLLNVYFPYWQDTFFAKSYYLRVDGKPVLYLYDVDEMLRDFEGSQSAMKAALAALRDKAVQAGHEGLIVACNRPDRSTSATALQDQADIGCDYAFVYNWWVRREADQSNPTNEKAIASQLERLQQWKTNQQILPSIPTLSMGWNSSPLRAPPINHSTSMEWTLPPDGPHSYQTLAHGVRELLPGWRHLGSKQLLLLDNWSEWTEGHYIGPTRAEGFGYLDAIRSTFTSAPDEHTDLRPPTTIESWFCDDAYPDVCALTPIGNVSAVSPAGVINGWALDTNRASQAVEIHFYIDGTVTEFGTFQGATTASRPRPDVNEVTGWPGNHGFTFTIPKSYHDGTPHRFCAYASSATVRRFGLLNRRKQLQFTCHPGTTSNCTSVMLEADCRH